MKAISYKQAASAVKRKIVKGMHCIRLTPYHHKSNVQNLNGVKVVVVVMV